MNYGDRVKGIPHTLTSDPLWNVEVYRLALFAGDLGWDDATKLTRDRRMLGLADQLYRALGSISTNICEGYSRGTGRDRARFYEYALGSARESRDWYYKARHVLGEAVLAHRLDLLISVIRMLLKIIPDQRGHYIKEGPDASEYRKRPRPDRAC